MMSRQHFNLLLLTSVLALSFPGIMPAAPANVTGRWDTLSYLMPINPIHVVLLRTGKVLIVAGSEFEAQKHAQQLSRAGVWDIQSGTVTIQNLQWDVFCNGMAVLPDGRPIVVGGTQQYDPFYGEARATIFDPVTEKFIEAQEMAHGRWYATVMALADGRVLTFSGTDETGAVNKAVEMYNVLGWSPEYPAPFYPQLYPWLHLLPNGNVFYSGSTPQSAIFNPTTKVWTPNVAQTISGAIRTYGSSVLLPLRPQTGYAPRVMILGGGNPATASTEIIDLSAAPKWVSSGNMSAPRIQGDAVLLPNGKLLVAGGSSVDENASTASLAADMYDPETGAWSSAGTATYPRLYHSVAILLPDGRVAAAGSNPTRGSYEQHVEMYSPPYLFTTDAGGAVIPATRPTISSAPANIGYGSAFTVQTPDAANISSAVLMRPGSNTHAYDMEQRLVGLTFTAGAGTLTVMAPPNGNIAPPGYYMLFLLNSANVPSVATFVRLSADPANAAPAGVITQPASDVTVHAGQSVIFSGTGSDTAPGTVTGYSWIFPEGSPFTSNVPTPGAVFFNKTGTYVASLTVVDDQGRNDPSPPTRTITVVAAQLGVTINSPAPNGAVSGGKSQLKASVSGTSGKSNTFTASIDGTVVARTVTVKSSANLSWDTRQWPNGTHTLTVAVTDATGKSGTASEPVLVRN